LSKVSSGRSRIRFTSLARVDAEARAALVRDAVAVTHAGGNGYYAA
jgi:hypothetical protein